MSQESEHATTSPQTDPPSRCQQQVDNGFNVDMQPMEFSSSASSTPTEPGGFESLLPEATKAVGDAQSSHIVQEKGDEGDNCFAELARTEPWPERGGTPLHSREADHGDFVLVVDTSAAIVPRPENRESAASAVADESLDINLERCDSISTVNEYLTPDGSEMSITDVPPPGSISRGGRSSLAQDPFDDDVADLFCSSLEVFPTSKQHVEDIPHFLAVLKASSESLQSKTPTPPMVEEPPHILNIAMAEATIADSVNSDTQSHLNTSDEELDKTSSTEQTATILDISDQRVNFVNTPSSLSPISSHGGSLEQAMGLGYHRMSNARSTSSSSSHSSSSSSRLNIPLEHVEIPLTPARHSPHPDSSPAVTSVTKLLPSSSSTIEIKRAKSVGKRFCRPFSWAKFKAMVERKFCSFAGHFKSNDTRKKGFFNPNAQRTASRRLFEEGLDDDCNDVFGEGQMGRQGGRVPCLRIDSDGDEPLEDLSNETSDRFYSARMQWNVRGIYQRAASYVHSIWCRGS